MMEMVIIIRDNERLAYRKEASDWETGISLLTDAHLAWEIEHGHAVSVLPERQAAYRERKEE
jgi:hypothetical protein